LRTYQKDRREFRWKSTLTALIQLFVQYPALIDYALPRLSSRSVCTNTLGAALSDMIDAREFLAPRMLWAAFRP
jgi:hypothetical protein